MDNSAWDDLLNGLKVGDIAHIVAVEWGLYLEQLPAGTEFELVVGNVYGEVVRMFESGVAVAPQVFVDGGVRNVVTIPYSAIREVIILEPK